MGDPRGAERLASAGLLRVARLASHVAPPRPAATTPSSSWSPSPARAAAPLRAGAGPVVIVGGMVMDFQARPGGVDVQAGTSVPGTVRQAFGGVGRNIAECLGLLQPSRPPLLISVVGDDPAGRALLDHMEACGLPTRGVLVEPSAATPSVAAVFSAAGEVAACVADVGALEAHLRPGAVLPRFLDDIRGAAAVLLDGNLCAETIEAVAAAAASAGVPTFFEPVSVPKAVRARRCLPLVSFASPNGGELVAMAGGGLGGAGGGAAGEGGGGGVEGALAVLRPHIAAALGAGVETIVLTLGEHGCVLCTANPGGGKAGGGGGGTIRAVHLPAVPAQLVNCSGAGDCLVAGALWGLSSGCPPEEAVARGAAVAKRAVETPGNVPPTDRLEPRALLEDAARVLSKRRVLII